MVITYPSVRAAATPPKRLPCHRVHDVVPIFARLLPLFLHLPHLINAKTSDRCATYMKTSRSGKTTPVIKKEVQALKKEEQEPLLSGTTPRSQEAVKKEEE